MTLDPLAYTKNYGLRKLRAGQAFSVDSYKYTDNDRDLLDLLLFMAGEGHHHSGEAVVTEVLDSSPLAVAQTTGGAMPAGQRFYYLYTLIDPRGFETAASPETYVDMPPAIAAPGAPIVEQDSVGGSLPPGNFYYGLSAYTEFDNLETAVEHTVYAAVPFVTSTNKVTLTLPILPGGADGFNVYRRTPSGVGLLHVGTIDMTGATPPTTFVDDGLVTEDCDRFAPARSTAQSRNSVLIQLPGDTPSVAPGYAWRIYRGMQSGVYGDLVTIADGSVNYTDTGTMTTPGQPPVVGISPSSPSRVQLTNGVEVQGRLPMGMVSAYPQDEVFTFPGQVVIAQGTIVWSCPFPQATIVGVQAVLGRGSVPDSSPVIVDVNSYDADADSWDSIFTASGDQPTVEIGTQVGSSVVPTAKTEIVQGDLLSVDVDQAGGGAGTDSDLVVIISLEVYGYTSFVSHEWAIP